MILKAKKITAHVSQLINQRQRFISRLTSSEITCLEKQQSRDGFYSIAIEFPLYKD